MKRLLGEVRRRLSRRTAVRRGPAWRPAPRIRIEFGGEARKVRGPAPVGVRPGL